MSASFQKREQCFFLLCFFPLLLIVIVLKNLCLFNMYLWCDSHYIAEVQHCMMILHFTLNFESLERLLYSNLKNIQNYLYYCYLFCGQEFSRISPKKLFKEHSVCHKPETHEGTGKHDNEIIKLPSRRTY